MTKWSEGNVRLRAARESIGLSSQPAFVKALVAAGERVGHQLSVTSRTVRRWESARPGWPHAPHVEALEELFGRPITELGFTPRKTRADDGSATTANPPAVTRITSVRSVRHDLPDSVATDYAALTASYRRLYWTLPATTLQPSANLHSQLGLDILDAVTGDAHAGLASAVAEACLLSGRIAFFDRRDPEEARPHFVWALECAQEAANNALGAAVLAHMAFAPAFSGDSDRADEARDHIRAARAFAKRAGDPSALIAWISAVDAEVETIAGNTQRALQLVGEAEELYDAAAAVPDWLDWFSPALLAGFKGNTLLAAGRAHEARTTLEGVLNDLPEVNSKQRAITYADLAAVAAVTNEPERACELLIKALDELRIAWYATAMTRIKAVRAILRQWEDSPAVTNLDAHLYDWTATIDALT